jgi:E3 ubiquitin-protein ligase TRIP12
VKVDRNNVLNEAISLTKVINKRAFLEIEYKEEEGTGLGPTLEFYTLVSEQLKNQDPPIWRT